MGMDKDVQLKKEHRKSYRDSRRFDRTCRNHGSCPQCEQRRTFFDTRHRFAADDQISETFFVELSA